MNEFDFSFRDIVECANDVIIVTKAYPIDEPGPEIVYVNKAFTDLTGYTPEDVVGKSPRILQSEGTDGETKDQVRQALEQRNSVRVTIKNYSKFGEEYWLDLSILPLKDSQGSVTHFVAIQRDVTEQQNIQSQLEIASRTDPLTGLLNRRAFDDITKTELSRSKRSYTSYSVLMLDVDEFKKINDGYGHLAGDAVLTSVARTLESNLRSHEKVARIGGDEFCVFLPDTDQTAAIDIAEKLRQVISSNAIPTGHADISITVSIGVSEVEDIDFDYTDIFKRADKNLYMAKKTGRNRIFSSLCA